ncbi:MAG: hypothetical protein JWN07_77 [Hyphomicrobiales bacterium]|nr:hypothetical protein [Hyphomicrobiales bacterium]
MVDWQTDERVRERAYRLWLEEGQPEGRAEAHWDMARELVAIEESQRDTLLPNPTLEYENNPTTEQIEELDLEKNLGEFPTLTDQGEEATTPDPALVQETAEAPLRSGSGNRKKRSA